MKILYEGLQLFDIILTKTIKTNEKYSAVETQMVSQ
jgi:hypothetical protein